MEEVSSQKIRVRIAPSPTGPLHVGTARTALFNFLFAKRYGGYFVLRIEDTDLERSDPAFERDIMEQLRWLGVKWDEGIDVGGAFKPYRQSERHYAPYIERLLNEDRAYSCFCSKEELEEARKTQFIKGQAPTYSGTCAKLDLATQDRYRKENRASIIRFRMPATSVTFRDLVRGEVTFNTALFGDIAIAKNVSTPLYNLAVVIDDAEMEITHVIRGEDHISNTPKQMLLSEALNLPKVAYAHIPLILGPDREKLSKRHGAVSIKEFRDAGYFPEAVTNTLALLGWHPEKEQEHFHLQELMEAFSLERVQKAGAIFDYKKLDWFDRYYATHRDARWRTPKDEDPLLPNLLALLQGHGITVPEMRNRAAVALPLIRQRLESPGELPLRLEEFLFFFKPPKLDRDLLSWKDMSTEEVGEMLKRSQEILSHIPEEGFTKEALENVLLKEAAKYGDRGKLLWPLRAALSGQKASPGPHEIAAVLGKEETLARVAQGIFQLQD